MTPYDELGILIERAIGGRGRKFVYSFSIWLTIYYVPSRSTIPP